MNRRTKRWVGRMLSVAWVIYLCGQMASGADVNDAPGVTVWALGGDGVQELRIGYRDLLPNTEFAVGGVHLDAPDDGVEEWPIRGYAIAHAMSADMIAKALGASITLPDGDLYAGLFGEYTYDREDEFAGGWLVGAQVSWPGNWKTVVEYQGTVFNASDDDWQIVAGLCRRF